MLETGIKDKGRWWSREDLVLLVLMGALFYLPGLGRIALFDRDEPRFATAAREMVRRGDYVVPHFNGALRPDKPPLVYWLMGTAYRVVGENELGARLPSAVCGMLTLLVIYGMAGARFGRLTGLLAGLIFGSCSLFIVESRLATADGTMMFFIVVCMACVWQAWDAGNPPGDEEAGGAGAARLPRADRLLHHDVDGDGTPAIVLDHLPLVKRRRMPFWLAMVFWGALAEGILTKGVPLFFVLVPVVVLSLVTRKWKWIGQLRPMWGVPLMVILVGWWVVLAGMRTNWVLIDDMVGLHFLARVAGPLAKYLPFSHADVARPGGNDPMSSYARPPGFYLALVWVTFWPWSVLLVPAAFHAVRRALGRTAIAMDRRPYQFLLAWVVPMWVVLELARGKLLHYPLPLYVGMAILCADALVQGWHRLTEVFAAAWFAGARWVILAIWMGMGAAVLWGAKMSGDEELLWRCILLSGALVAVGVAATIAWGRPSWPFVTALGWAAALVVADVVVLPGIGTIQVSRMVGERMAAMKEADPGLVLAAEGYEEPTLVFYAGGRVAMGAEAAKVIEEGERYVAAVDAGTADKLKEKGVDFYVAMQRRGVNPANQKGVTVELITNVRPETRPATSSQPGTRGAGGAD